MFEKLVAVFLVLALFLAVWRLESGWRIVFTPFLLAMYFELTRIFPAFLLAERYSGIEGNYALWVAFGAYAALLCGFVVWRCFPRAYPREVLALSMIATPVRVDRFDLLGVLVLALILGALGLYFFGGLPATVKSGLSLVTAGGSADLAVLVSQQRLEFTKGAYFGAEYRGQGLVSEFQQIGWMLICVFVLLRHLEQRRLGSLIAVFAAVLGAWVFVGGFGSRAPLLNIFICMLVAYSLRRPLSLRAVGVAIGGGVMLAVLLSVYSSKMYSLLAGSLGIGDFLAQALVKIAERTLIGNGINDVYAIEFVRTGALEIGYGSIHFRDLVTAIPGVQYGQPLAYKLYLLIDDSGHTTMFRSGTYLSDVFVDFYWPGVIAIYFGIGILLAVAQQWVLRTRPDAWAIAIAVAVAFCAMNVLSGGPVSLGSSLAVLVVLWTVHKSVRLALRELAIASDALVLLPRDRSSRA